MAASQADADEIDRLNAHADQLEAQLDTVQQAFQTLTTAVELTARALGAALLKATGEPETAVRAPVLRLPMRPDTPKTTPAPAEPPAGADHGTTH